jgi:uncharacterized protein
LLSWLSDNVNRKGKTISNSLRKFRQTKFMTLQYLIQAKRSEIITIAAKHGAYNIRIFGSVARGEATEKSDIDFLVDYDPSKRSSWFPMGLMFELENLLE